MDILLSQLRGLSVVTRRGVALGNIVNAEIDPDTRRIIRYHVRRSGFFPRLGGKELLIADAQVIALTPTELIVEDTDTPVRETSAKLSQSFPEPATPPLSTRS